MFAVSPHKHATCVFPGDLKAQWAWKSAALPSDRHRFLGCSFHRAIKEGLSAAGWLWATPTPSHSAPGTVHLNLFRFILFLFICGGTLQHVASHCSSLSRKRSLHSWRHFDTIIKSQLTVLARAGVTCICVPADSTWVLGWLLLVLGKFMQLNRDPSNWPVALGNGTSSGATLEHSHLHPM